MILTASGASTDSGANGPRVVACGAVITITQGVRSITMIGLTRCAIRIDGAPCNIGDENEYLEQEPEIENHDAVGTCTRSLQP